MKSEGPLLPEAPKTQERGSLTVEEREGFLKRIEQVEISLKANFAELQATRRDLEAFIEKRPELSTGENKDDDVAKWDKGLARVQTAYEDSKRELDSFAKTLAIWGIVVSNISNLALSAMQSGHLDSSERLLNWGLSGSAGGAVTIGIAAAVWSFGGLINGVIREVRKWRHKVAGDKEVDAKRDARGKEGFA